MICVVPDVQKVRRKPHCEGQNDRIAEGVEEVGVAGDQTPHRLHGADTLIMRGFRRFECVLPRIRVSARFHGRVEITARLSTVLHKPPSSDVYGRFARERPLVMSEPLRILRRDTPRLRPPGYLQAGKEILRPLDEIPTWF